MKSSRGTRYQTLRRELTLFTRGMFAAEREIHVESNEKRDCVNRGRRNLQFQTARQLYSFNIPPLLRQNSLKSRGIVDWRRMAEKPLDSGVEDDYVREDEGENESRCATTGKFVFPHGLRLLRPSNLWSLFLRAVTICPRIDNFENTSFRCSRHSI